MKGGKKRDTIIDDAQTSATPSTDVDVAVVSSDNDGGVMVGEEGLRNSEEHEKFEAAEEDFEDEGEGDSEEDRDEEQMEDAQIERTEMSEGERTKLADGYYEIEAVRRKRVRKGNVQYLIKWRGWSEAENTWEPLENLMQVKDVIDAFEESRKAGKSRSARKRRRKAGVTPIQTKKKQQTHQQSPATASCRVPSHIIRIAEEPLSFSKLNELSCANKGVGTCINRMDGGQSFRVNENIGRVDSLLMEEKKAPNAEETIRLSLEPQEGQSTGGNTLTNRGGKMDGGESIQSDRFTGAKKRKSGSVKRFRKDPAVCSVDDSPIGISACTSPVPVDIQHHEFPANCKNRHDESRSLCTITEIVKVIGCKTSISNHIKEVVVAFEALRSDGTKVMVDNRFLKANNPLLLIDYYEKNLRCIPA